MLSVEEALDRVLETVTVLPGETVSPDRAGGRRLAFGLTASQDAPRFDKSMMDGFAVRSGDFGEQPRTLSVVRMIAAGGQSGEPLEQNSAVRIMTGAPLPQNADCVIPIELADFEEERSGEVTISPDHVSPERHVLRTGSFIRSGADLLSAGIEIQPIHVALLAEFGFAEITVTRQPACAVLATGDELVPVGDPVPAGCIRNSNEPMLVSQVMQSGGVPRPLGIAADRESDLRERIEEGLQSDVLLLSGGVSAGEFDLVPKVLRSCGVREVFHRINLKPGKPLWFGVLQKGDHCCRVFGLPGNPVSSFVCFELFVRPALQAAGGAPDPVRGRVRARLSVSHAVRGDRFVCFPSRLKAGEDGFEVTPVPWRGSADLVSTSAANSMCLLAPQSAEYRAGDIVDVIPWGIDFPVG